MPSRTALTHTPVSANLQHPGPPAAGDLARSRNHAPRPGTERDPGNLTAELTAEMHRLQRSFEAELKPSGDLGRLLVRRMAMMSVRMDRCVANETATLSARILQAEADFDAEWPEEEGQDDPEREKMRVQATHLALFDPSKEAILARKHEAAAERSFFRALKEFRTVEREARAAKPALEAAPARSELGSSFPEVSKVVKVGPPAVGLARKVEVSPPKPIAPASLPGTKAVPTLSIPPRLPAVAWSEVPFTIGRAV